jgi:hypothetical protein
MHKVTEIAIKEYRQFFANNFPNDEYMQKVCEADVQNFIVIDRYLSNAKEAAKALWNMDTAPRDFYFDVLHKVDRALYNKINNDFI